MEDKLMALTERLSAVAEASLRDGLDPRQPHPLDFSERQITITMTGAEWFTVFAKLSGHSLKHFGDELLRQSMQDMTDWLKREVNR